MTGGGAMPPEGGARAHVMELARKARTLGVQHVPPSMLHRACQGDKALYIEAMIEAGYIVPKDASEEADRVS